MSSISPESAEHRKSYVFSPFVDWLLRLGREERVNWVAELNRGLDRFPALATRDRKKLLRGIVVNDVFVRIMFRFQMRLPSVAIFMARFVRVYGAAHIFRETPTDRSIIISLTHFGPVHFLCAALIPRLRGRNVYVMHAGGETGDPVARYMRKLGAIPLLNDDRALRKLSSLLAEDPGCVIMYAFDYMGTRGRKPIPFLGAMVAVGRSVAHLADRYNPLVTTVFWEHGAAIGCARVLGPLQVDAGLGREERQDGLTRQLFGLVESRVLKTPWEWTEWVNCADRADIVNDKSNVLGNSE